MSKIYNIALLGCGKVAHLHARAAMEISNSRLAGFGAAGAPVRIPSPQNTAPPLILLWVNSSGKKK